MSLVEAFATAIKFFNWKKVCLITWLFSSEALDHLISKGQRSNYSCMLLNRIFSISEVTLDPLIGLPNRLQLLDSILIPVTNASTRDIWVIFIYMYLGDTSRPVVCMPFSDHYHWRPSPTPGPRSNTSWPCLPLRSPLCTTHTRSPLRTTTANTITTTLLWSLPIPQTDNVAGIGIGHSQRSYCDTSHIYPDGAEAGRQEFAQALYPKEGSTR